MIFSIVIFIGAALLGIFRLAQSKAESDKRLNRFVTGSSVIVILVVLGCSVWQVFDTIENNQAKEEETMASEKRIKRGIDSGIAVNSGNIDVVKNQNVRLKQIVDSLTGHVTEQKKQITGLSTENYNMSQQLLKTTKSLTDNLTGGDSFCEFSLVPLDASTARLAVDHHGNTTMYDISVIVSDRKVKTSERQFNNYNVGNLQPGTAQILGNIKGNFSIGPIDYLFQISARNGNFLQPFTFIK